VRLPTLEGALFVLKSNGVSKTAQKERPGALFRASLDTAINRSAGFVLTKRFVADPLRNHLSLMRH
jgi:hypothetical protein